MNLTDWAKVQTLRVIPPEINGTRREWRHVTVNHELRDDGKTLVIVLWDDGDEARDEPVSLPTFTGETIDWTKITRVGVVPPANTGVEFQDAYREHWNVTVEPVVQDDGRTLNLFRRAEGDWRDQGTKEPVGFPPQRPANAVVWVSTPHNVRGIDTFARGLSLMYGPGLIIEHAPGGYWVKTPNQPDDGGPLTDKADLAEPVKEDDWHTPPETPRRDDDPVPTEATE